MNRERWVQVQELFHAALERDRAARILFLDEACAGDAGLRVEVESLLASHEEAGDFLDAPLRELELPSDSTPESSTMKGRRLGPYQIERELGRGGMGVVYLARDTRLDRPVALKALPAPFALDDRRRERLKLEARAAGALSHPGIATVYALEEIGDDLYIACEYVVGRTLREVIGRGPLPPGSLLDVALQVARALQAAHERGIVHRDLKPENVVMREDGCVKILDFGLARLLPSAAELAATRLTTAGMILGTPAYMAPEQLQGRDVDFRADLFAFGILVRELATGRHPFDDGRSDVMVARILESDPPQLQSHPALPPALDGVIRVCLERDRERRYARTADLVSDLERVNTDPDAPVRIPSGAPAATTPQPNPRWWWQFHQAAVAVAYSAAMVPAWHARAWIPKGFATAFFFGALAAVIVGAGLRLHLLFTARFLSDDLAAQHAALARVVRGADWALALLLLAGGLAASEAQPALAALLVGIGLGSAVAFLFVEPATTRAAFRRTERPVDDRRAGSSPA